MMMVIVFLFFILAWLFVLLQLQWRRPPGRAIRTGTLLRYRFAEQMNSSVNRDDGSATLLNIPGRDLAAARSVSPLRGTDRCIGLQVLNKHLFHTGLPLPGVPGI